MRISRILSSSLLVFACSVPLGCDDGGASDEDRDASSEQDAGEDSGVERDADSDPDPEDDAGTQGPSLAIDELCSLLRENAEEWYCSDSDPSCQDLITQSTQRCEALALAIEQGRLRYDAQRLHACVEGLNKEALTAAFVDQIFACPGAFSGQVADGEDCYYDHAFYLDECGQGLYCDRSTGTCPGQCRPYQQEGEACPSAGYCAPELTCLRDCTPPCDGTCGPRPKLGESCETSWGACAEGLICDATMSPHTCIMRRPLGASCTRDYHCESFTCVEETCAEKPVSMCRRSLQCPADQACLQENGAGTCVPRLAAGAACEHAEDGCVEGYECLWHPENGTAECRKAGLDGESCSPWGCEPDHYCANESGNLVCRPDLAMGEDCNSVSYDTLHDNSPCASGLRCMLSNTGTCLPAGSEGEPCYYNDTQSCEAGLVCLGFVNSTCQPPGELDEPCAPAFDNACNDGVCRCTDFEDESCNAWTCVALLANGATCDDSALCRSGHCDDSQDPPVCADDAFVPEGLCLP